MATRIVRTRPAPAAKVAQHTDKYLLLRVTMMPGANLFDVSGVVKKALVEAAKEVSPDVHSKVFLEAIHIDQHFAERILKGDAL